MYHGTISFVRPAQAMTAAAIVRNLDPTAHVDEPKPGQCFVEFELTDKVNAGIVDHVHAANEQGSGPLSYEVLAPA